MEKELEFQDEQPEFDWIQLHNELSEDNMEETNQEKMIRKIKENPFVPAGAIATTMALCYGLYSLKKGKKKMSQYMMRTRIVAQGFTVVAIVVGLGLSASKKTENQS